MAAAAAALTAGRAALRDARWAAAREQFEAALAVDESPEALEGLSWAAWWLDDDEAVFAAREHAYRLYRRRGDAAAAARMATWLAVDQLDFRGAWAVANGWLRRAHRLLDPLEPGPEHGWLAFEEGYLAHAARRHRDRAGAAPPTRRGSAGEHGVADLEMLGLALEGATLVTCARVADGMRYLDEATATALEGDAAIPISRAWTFCFLVSACASTLDFGRAVAWCDRNAEFAERHGSRYMLAFCRAEYGAVQLWRGRWPEAEALLEAAVEDFSALAPGVGGGAPGRARGAAPPPGPARGRDGAARPGGAVDQGAALPRPARARAPASAAGGRPARAPAPAGSRPTAAWSARPRWSCSSTRAPRAASSRRAPPPWRSCARRSGWPGPRRCAPAATWPTACSPPPAATTSARACCSRTPSTASSAAARRSRPPRRAWSSPPA